MSYPRHQLARAHKFVSYIGGDITPSVSTTNWTAIHATAFDLTVAAQVGDTLAVTFSFRYLGGNNTGTDAFTLVGGNPINGVSGVAYSAGANGGVGGMFHQQSGTDGNFARVLYTVQATDLSAGTVTLRPYERQISASGTALTVYASASGGAAFFGVENLGPMDPN